MKVEKIAFNGEKTFIFLPVSLFNKLHTILVVAYEGIEEMPQEGLNILLAISKITGTFLEKQENEKLLKSRQEHIEKLLDQEQQLRSLLKIIASVNDLLITSESTELLLNRSCQRLTDYRKYHLVMILLKDHNELYFFTKERSKLNQITKIQESLKEGFLKNKKVQESIENSEYIQIDNFHNLDNKAFTEITKNLEINNIHLLPLKKDIKSDSFGALMVFSTNHAVYEFANEEMQMLQELAGDIGFAIESYRQKERLIELNKSITTILDATMEGIFVFEKGTCIDTNEEAVKLFEYDDKQAILGKNILDFVQVNSKKSVKDKIDAKIEHPYEVTLLKRSGDHFSALVRTIHIVLDKKERTIFTVVDLSEIKNKDQILYQQSKMAAMGEMIGNIAHQWRQPLTVISMGVNNTLADIELNMVDNESLKESSLNILKQTRFLSKTIDDFRNFFTPNKEKSEFTTKHSIDKTMELVAASFKTHEIEVIEDIEVIQITALENELTQAILNIIKNAKDILLTVDNRRRLIFIKVYEKNKTVFMEIIDSGGGVPKDVIDKVFEPYFTTKAKSQGTGIGLYMTQSIITKHLHGKLYVQNVEYEYEGAKYKGAKFTIEIPLIDKDPKEG
ncbi:MAG: ATP-binding protein [Campylobacterota bacterium]|nr:ATP-binding protein [Campylobacterota bacterium]